MARQKGTPPARKQLAKSPTGIQGLDEVTSGGLPRGRPTLVCGGAGSGKTLLAMQFLVKGAMDYGEPGVFMSFEETAEELTQNVRSLGFDLDDLVARKKIFVDFVRVERSEIEETGEYDLEGLFIRLGNAVRAVGAKRVVLDTIETLFSGLSNAGIVRAELRRLFRWLKDKGMTAVITGERGVDTLTRHGLEEYVSDCVIFLDHRVNEQISTRRLRIIKYRGSTHGTNEFPFLIDDKGIMVMPITSIGLKHVVSPERIPTGIPRFDAMFGGKGFYRGSTVLISGTAGTGKTSLAAHFTDAACRRGERCLFFAYEESESQVVRNMRSIGIDLEPWTKRGLLRIHAERPTLYGLEAHLAETYAMVAAFKPRVVVIDPISNFAAVANQRDIKAMLTRLLDEMKVEHITTMFTSLTQASVPSQESTDVGISSLADTWILLRDIEIGGERNRGIYILKSRGMAHSNQIREFRLTSHGVDLADVYIGPAGVLTGSARLAQEAKDRAEKVAIQDDAEIKRLGLESKRRAMESAIASIRARFEAEEMDLKRLLSQARLRGEVAEADRERMAQSRKADARPGKKA
jgi:circadian clock protein KaiC